MIRSSKLGENLLVASNKRFHVWVSFLSLGSVWQRNICIYLFVGHYLAIVSSEQYSSELQLEGKSGEITGNRIRDYMKA